MKENSLFHFEPGNLFFCLFSSVYLEIKNG